MIRSAGGGQARAILGVVEIGALQDGGGIAGAEVIAQRGDVGRDGAVAERDEHPGARTDPVQERKVVLVADGALDEAHGDAFGVVFAIDDGAVDDVDPGGEVEEELVEVEERHVAAGAAAEPDGGDFQTLHSFFSRALTRNSSFERSRTISPTVEPRW